MKEERREKKKRGVTVVTVVTVVTIVTVFRGGVYEIGLLSNCYYYI